LGEQFATVWDAIADDPRKARHLQVRADLMIALHRLIADRRLTQSRAAKLLGVTQPRISDLVRGKIERFSIDTLVEMLARAGMSVRLSVEDQAA
jgi:predicted XRE-type DNA-binding protein